MPDEALFEEDADPYTTSLADYALGILLGSKPKILDEVLHSPHAKKWQEVYDYEIAQLEKHNTWEIVKLPPGKIPIPHSLVFKKKLGADSNIESWCVWFRAGGHRQKYGIDYNETFATVAKMLSI